MANGNTQTMNDLTEHYAPEAPIHWGAVWSGTLVAMAVMLVLDLLGAAITVVTLSATTAPTASAIWTGVVGIIAFFIGGWVTGMSMYKETSGNGAYNGAMVFMLAVPIMLALAVLGLGDLATTFGGLSGNAGGSAGAATQISNGVIWAALIDSVLAWIAAALGGWAGAASQK